MYGIVKLGIIRSQNEEAAILQRNHLVDLVNMCALGYVDIVGRFGDDGNLRGITICSVPILVKADSLANANSWVKAGGLVIEIHPWCTGKSLPLR